MPPSHTGHALQTLMVIHLGAQDLGEGEAPAYAFLVQYGAFYIYLWTPTQPLAHPGCASGCVVECRICNREVAVQIARSLLCTKVYSAFYPSGVGKWVPAAAGKAKAGMADCNCGWTCGCAGKTVKSLRTCALPECFCGGDSLRRGTISSVCTFTFTQTIRPKVTKFGMVTRVL